MTYTIRHRKEFPKHIKRFALERSQGMCEAVGVEYDLAAIKLAEGTP